MAGKSKAPKLRVIDAAKSPEQPAFILTHLEMRLIRAFRTCDDECQDFMVDCAETYAKDSELMRHSQKPPYLRLVGSNDLIAG